jgi:site-specific DNA-methyltransferase (adenine-specific)
MIPTTETPDNHTDATPAPYYDSDGIRIYRGDCFGILHTLQNLDAVITDPPYSTGGAFRGDRTISTVTKYVQNSVQQYRPEFAGDNRDQRSFLAWSSLWMAAAFNASRPGAIVGSFIDWRQLPTLSDAIQAGGWTWRGMGVWSKKYGRPCPGQFTNACEFLLWGSRGPLKPAEPRVYPCGVIKTDDTDDHDPAADYCLPDFVEAASPGSKKIHIAQKPETVMAWALSIVPPGSIICDPFMGSGSTLVAAKAAGLRAIGIESDPLYCDAAADRLDATPRPELAPPADRN